MIFKNTYGYGDKARRIMAHGCIHTLFMYASMAYLESIPQYRSCAQKVRQAQRTLNTLCGRAYKDVGYAASTVLAGIPPLHLLIEKRNILESVKKEYYPIPFYNLGPIIIEGKTLKEIEALLDEEVGKHWQSLWIMSAPQINGLKSLSQV